jgi:NAD(P)H dehydrogenase (quinone)
MGKPTEPQVSVTDTADIKVWFASQFVLTGFFIGHIFSFLSDITSPSCTNWTKAGAAGVKHIVYTSTPNADPGSTNPLLADHGQTEVALAASGVPWTALRNSFYAEALKGFLDLLLVNGQLLIPEGSAKHSWISREDCARATTGALIGKLTTTGPVDVTGPEAFSFADLASRLSSLSDHQITAFALPDQEIIAQITAKGVPAEAANSTVRLISWVAREASSTPTDTVERAWSTKPTSIDFILRTLVTA